jgi:hypothetical protein
MDSWLNRHFSDEDTEMVGRCIKIKMLTIVSCQGNANQNHNEISLHSISKKTLTARHCDSCV